MSNVKISQSYLKFFLRRHALLWFFTWRHINLFWKPSGYLCLLLREYFCCTRLKLTLHSVFVCFVWMYLSVFVLVYVYLQLSAIQTIKIWYMIYQTYKWYILDVANMHFFRDFLPVKKNWSNYILISYHIKSIYQYQFCYFSSFFIFFIFCLLPPFIQLTSIKYVKFSRLQQIFKNALCVLFISSSLGLFAVSYYPQHWCTSHYILHIYTAQHCTTLHNTSPHQINVWLMLRQM